MQIIIVNAVITRLLCGCKLTQEARAAQRGACGPAHRQFAHTMLDYLTDSRELIRRTPAS